MKSGRLIRMHFSWSRQEMMLVGLGYQERWGDVGGFEVYFVGFGGQLDVEVQGRKQSSVVSRFCCQMDGMIYSEQETGI